MLVTDSLCPIEIDLEKNAFDAKKNALRCDQQVLTCASRLCTVCAATSVSADDMLANAAALSAGDIEVESSRAKPAD